MTRPKRYWDTASYRRKESRIERAIRLWHRPQTSWDVCPCHGRIMVHPSWRGLLKK